MITALDSINISVADVAAAAPAMERLLGRSVSAGKESATVRLANMSLDLVASQDGSEGLSGLAFAVENVEQAHRVSERRALKPGAPAVSAVGRRIGLDVAATFGVPVTLVEYAKPPQPEGNAGEAAITGLDHVVVRTTHPNRAAALYGARLGLDMRLDRTEPKWGARLMWDPLESTCRHASLSIL